MSRLRDRRFVVAFFFLVFLVATRDAAASDLTAFIAAQTVDPLSGGCCKGVPLRTGYGLGLRFENSGHVWQGFGYTDMKWAEVSALKSTYLIGDYVKPDPGSGVDSLVTRIKKWQVILSYGVGFFIHTTTTARFDLPVVLNGFLGVAHLETQYAIDERYSLVGLGRIGTAISFDDKSMIAAGMGGVLIRF